MNAFDWCLIAAVCAITVTFVHYCHRGDDRQWRESTGHDPQTVADDVTEARRERERAELEAWLRLPLQPRNTIPHQTRRTEEDR